jgi:hypothetical protein
MSLKEVPQKFPGTQRSTRAPFWTSLALLQSFLRLTTYTDPLSETKQKIKIMRSENVFILLQLLTVSADVRLRS